MKKLILTGLTAALLSTAAMAEVTGYTPAVSGQSATAASINANFDALIASINSNAARLDALESYDIAGKTYDYKEIAFIWAAETYGQITSAPGGELRFRDNGFARVGMLTVAAELTFNNDGTVNVSGQEKEIEMFVNSISDIGTVANSGFVDAATWNQLGNTVTVTFTDGFVLELTVSKGGNIITSMVANETDLESTQTDDKGTYRLYQTESALSIGTLKSELGE